MRREQTTLRFRARTPQEKRDSVIPFDPFARTAAEALELLELERVGAAVRHGDVALKCGLAGGWHNLALLLHQVPEKIRCADVHDHTCRRPNRQTAVSWVLAHEIISLFGSSPQRGKGVGGLKANNARSGELAI